MDPPTVVVLALVEREGRYLVQRRDRDPFRGLWEFPGGKLEAGEAPEAAVAREVKEECGLDVAVGHLVAAFPFDHPPPGPRVVLFAYRARLTGGATPPGARWATLDELEGMEMPAANARILAALRNPAPRSRDAS